MRTLTVSDSANRFQTRRGRALVVLAWCVRVSVFATCMGGAGWLLYAFLDFSWGVLLATGAAVALVWIGGWLSVRERLLWRLEVKGGTGLWLLIWGFTIAAAGVLIFQSPLARVHWILFPLAIATVTALSYALSYLVVQIFPESVCGWMEHCESAPEMKREYIDRDITEQRSSSGSSYVIEDVVVRSETIGYREYTQVCCIHCGIILRTADDAIHHYQDPP